MEYLRCTSHFLCTKEINLVVIKVRIGRRETGIR